MAASRSVFYGFVAYSVLAYAAGDKGSGSSDQNSQDVTAKALDWPGEAKGMDDTLRTFAGTPAGPWLLALTAVGLVAFGVFSWADARRREVRPDGRGARLGHPVTRQRCRGPRSATRQRRAEPKERGLLPTSQGRRGAAGVLRIGAA